MTDDPLDRNLTKILAEPEEAPEPAPEFREALRGRLRRELASTRPSPRRRLFETLVSVAAAAAIVLAVAFSGNRLLAPPPAADAETIRVADARSVPAFRAEPSHSMLYEDPVEYLRKKGVDVSLPGLVGHYRRLAGGEKSTIEMAKWATLDALSRRAGPAFAPLLAGLYDLDPDEGVRRQVLMLLERRRDRVVLPWLDARFADASAKLLPMVAKARVALKLPSPEAAKALHARATALGLFDPKGERYNAGSVPGLLRALSALGHPDATLEFARLLRAAPTVDLLIAAYDSLGGDPVPEAFGAALDRLVEAALEKEDVGYDEVGLLDVLGRLEDERFVPLLARILEDSYVPLHVEGARVAGAWRIKAAVPQLSRSLASLASLGEDGEDLEPALLWALARCGEGDAPKKLLALLSRTKWYRAGNWAVDALLDLEVPAAEIVLALPDESYVVGKLPQILESATNECLAAIDAKVATLEGGFLKKAFLLVRSLGTGADVRNYLKSVVDAGGNLGLSLTLSDVEKVRTLLTGKGGEHDKVMAVKAIRVLLAPREARLDLATTALAGPGVRVRSETARTLAWLGGPEAAHPLAEALRKEKDASVRERIAVALATMDPKEAAPAILRAFPEPGDVIALPRTPLTTVLGILGREMGEAAKSALFLAMEIQKGNDVHLAAAEGLARHGVQFGRETLAKTAQGDDLLPRTLAREALLTAAPDLLGEALAVAGDDDPLSNGYRRIIEGTERRPATPDGKRLFEYEISR